MHLWSIIYNFRFYNNLIWYGSLDFAIGHLSFSIDVWHFSINGGKVLLLFNRLYFNFGLFLFFFLFYILNFYRFFVKHWGTFSVLVKQFSSNANHSFWFRILHFIFKSIRHNGCGTSGEFLYQRFNFFFFNRLEDRFFYIFGILSQGFLRYFCLGLRYFT